MFYKSNKNLKDKKVKTKKVSSIKLMIEDFKVLKEEIKQKGFKEYMLSFFYKVGFSVDIQLMAISRVIQYYAKRVLKILFRWAQNLAKFFDNFMDLILDDIGEPIEKGNQTVQKIKAIYNENKQKGKIKAAKEVRVYILEGFKKNKDLLEKVFAYIFPTVFATIFIFVVANTLSQDYVIDVVLEGDVIGTVANYSTLDNAGNIIKNQLVQTTGEEWQLNAEINLVPSNDKTIIEERELANNILGASDENIIQATGLYVDGQFQGAVEDSDELSDVIDSLIAPYDTGEENKTVGFVKDVSLIDGVFFTDSIVEEDSMIQKVTGEVSGEVLYTVVAGDAPSIIAQKNGITLATLYALNPQMDEGKANLLPGDVLLVGASVPFLQVKVVETLTRDVVIPHASVVELNNTMDYFSTSISTYGEDGLNQELVEIEYIDNMKVKETVVATTVVKEPVTEVTQRGTVYNGTIVEPGSGVYIWPMISFRWSRGFTGQYPAHNGIDLAANTGTPIMAVDNGVVTKVVYGSSGYGYYVEVDHGTGYQSLYAHCSALYVYVGQQVTQGQVIAAIGSTGWSTGPHIHFEIKSGNYRYNPLNFLH